MENRTDRAGVISRYTSEYLANGQKAKEILDVVEKDGKKSTKTIAYTYDLLGRITKESRTGSKDITYTYDSNNNRKTMTVGNKVTAYKYNKNGNQPATFNRYEIPEEKKEKPYIDIDVTLGSSRLNKNVVNHYNAENQLVLELRTNGKVKKRYIRGNELVFSKKLC